MEGKTDVMQTSAKEGEIFSFRPHREKCDTKLQPTPPHMAKSHWKRRRREKFSSYENPYSQLANFPLLECTDHMQAQMDVEDHFNKKFSFYPRTDENGCVKWVLPPVERIYASPLWKDDSLQAMKMSLNQTKGQLTDKDVAAWQSHTTNTNPCQRIASAVRHNAQPEMVTQAWLKFYEIANAYPIVPEDPQEKEMPIPFNSVHLCEAPGAFILALNHYLALNRWGLKWQWLGNTLNPYYEGTSPDQCISEDRFIFLTLKNWVFGKDNTGNLMTRDNLEDLLKRAESLGPIHLVTADGSVDCQANPGKQEETTHSLHLWEAVAGLYLLEAGGSLVIKKFTFFESETVSLMYFLCCVFQEVHVYKPGTSKQGNSEVYVVAMDYVGKNACLSHLQRILEGHETQGTVRSLLAREDIPDAFVKQIYACSKFFKEHQENSIARNLSLFPSMHEKDKQYNELLKIKAVKLFFVRNNCTAIPKSMTLTERNVNRSRQLMDTDWSKVENASVIRLTAPQEKFQILTDFLLKCIEEYCPQKGAEQVTNVGDMMVHHVVPPKIEDVDYEVLRGKPFHWVNMTKFCSPKVFKIYSELHQLWQATSASKQHLPVDDGLVNKVALHLRNVQFIRDTHMLGPHSGCKALEQVVMLMETGDITVGGSVVLVDVPLLSRLQCGLLMAIQCAFSEVLIYTPQEVGTKAPVIVLKEFLSLDLGELAVRSLYRAGWNPEGGMGGAVGDLQVVSYPTLVRESLYSAVFHYNVNYCLHFANLFSQYIIVD